VNAEQFGSPMLRAVLIRTSEIETIVVGLPESHNKTLLFFAPRTRTEFGFSAGAGLVQTESDSDFRLTPGKFSRNLKI
jgi:hypothetical protein